MAIFAALSGRCDVGFAISLDDRRLRDDEARGEPMAAAAKRRFAPLP